MVLDFSTWGWYANPIDFTGWLAVPPEDRIFAHKNYTNIVHVDGHVKSVLRYESFYSTGGMDSNGTYLNQAWNPYMN
jgi:prepilin-type processing-associated H-X9-DG protein